MRLATINKNVFLIIIKQTICSAQYQAQIMSSVIKSNEEPNF